MRDPYNRIMNAAKEGRGVRLTADEAFILSFDDAIATRATVIGDEPEQWDAQRRVHDLPA